jgi:NADH-quinone oxidoreductase subunit G
MVVSLSPFKANMDVADVLLPIAPFTETAGTFVNAEGRAQSFHGVVKPLGETRPAWKVLRVLCDLLGVSAPFETAQEIAAAALPAGFESKLGNASTAAITTAAASREPVSASIYQLDGLVRRAASLQMTADAKAAATQVGVNA